jgi:hypothetical protein
MKFAGIILASLSMGAFARAEVSIDPAIMDQISEILHKPLKTYHSDLVANKSYLERIDRWADHFIQIDKAKQRKSRTQDRVSYSLEMFKNFPILSSGDTVKGLVSNKSFNLFYIKEPRKRKFLKALEMPSSRVLSNQEVIDAGMEFIRRNQFYRETEYEKMVSPLVISQKIRTEGLNRESDDIRTISQSVEFKREIFGYEVVNSKQVVDIHPETKEILAYRNILWTPVAVGSGTLTPYITYDEIVAQLDAMFNGSKKGLEICKVKAALFQGDDMLFPVLIIHSRHRLEGSEGNPEDHVFILSLVKGLELNKNKDELIYPAQVK